MSQLLSPLLSDMAANVHAQIDQLVTCKELLSTATLHMMTNVMMSPSTPYYNYKEFYTVMDKKVTYLRGVEAGRAQQNPNVAAMD